MSVKTVMRKRMGVTSFPSWQEFLYESAKAIAALKEIGTQVPKMYICYGMQDPLVYDDCVSFRDYLVKPNVPPIYVEGDGMHDIPYWDGQLEACFAFLKED